MNRYYLRKAIQKIWLEKRQFTNKAIRSFAISVDNLEQILLLFGKPTTKIYKKIKSTKNKKLTEIWKHFKNLNLNVSEGLKFRILIQMLIELKRIAKEIKKPFGKNLRLSKTNFSNPWVIFHKVMFYPSYCTWELACAYILINFITYIALTVSSTLRLKL